MTTTKHARADAPFDINHLRRGEFYRATSCTGRSVTGEYLGVEVAYDEWRILLRTVASTESLAIRHLDVVLPTAV